MLHLICHGNWPGYDIIGCDPSSPSLLTQTLSGIPVTGLESQLFLWLFLSCSLSCLLSSGKQAAANTVAQWSTFWTFAPFYLSRKHPLLYKCCFSWSIFETGCCTTAQIIAFDKRMTKKHAEVYQQRLWILWWCWSQSVCRKNQNAACANC